MNDDGQNISWDGMPQKFQQIMKQFKRSEILEDPLFILNSVFKTSNKDEGEGGV